MKKYFICCFIFLISCSSAQNEDMIIVEDSSSVTVTTTVSELTFENDHDEEGHVDHDHDDEGQDEKEGRCKYRRSALSVHRSRGQAGCLPDDSGSVRSESQ